MDTLENQKHSIATKVRRTQDMEDQQRELEQPPSVSERLDEDTLRRQKKDKVKQTERGLDHSRPKPLPSPSRKRQLSKIVETWSETPRLSFLDLPIEIRFMVYELFYIQTIHHTYKKTCPEGIFVCFTAIINSVPAISILATCHQINSEAQPYLIPKRDYVIAQPLRLLVDTGHARNALLSHLSPLRALFAYARFQQRNSRLHFDDFLEVFDGDALGFPSAHFTLGNVGTSLDYASLYNDPAFRNFIIKGAQRVKYNRKSPLTLHTIEIGLTAGRWREWEELPVRETISLYELYLYMDHFYRHQVGNTLIKLRAVVHLFSGMTAQDIDGSMSYIPGSGPNSYSNNSGVFGGARVNMNEWQQHWAEREAYDC